MSKPKRFSKSQTQKSHGCLPFSITLRAVTASVPKLLIEFAMEPRHKLGILSDENLNILRKFRQEAASPEQTNAQTHKPESKAGRNRKSWLLDVSQHILSGYNLLSRIEAAETTSK